MNVPDGVKTVVAEGGDLRAAVGEAAKLLGLVSSQVDYKMDLSHFRTAAGGSVARRTVKIVAWDSGRSPTDQRAEARPARPAADVQEKDDPTEESDQERTVPSQAREARPDGDGRADDRPRRGRGDRRDDRPRGDRPPREDRPRDERPREARPPRDERPRDERPRDERPRDERPGKPESLRGAEAGPTPASDFAQTWFLGLLGQMGVEGTVVGTGAGERVHLAVKADRAGRIVGKRGATLGSIRHLLTVALETAFPDLAAAGFVVDVDVGDDRPAEQRAPREERRDGFRGGDRGDRGDGGDRGGRGDRRGGRGDRGDRRGGRDGRDRSDDERGRYPQEKLEALARRAAEKAVETGQTITINVELNSFDRRIVHLTVGEIAGVRSQSEERPGADGRVVKYVQIIPHQE